jgi:hypothetical protein
VSRVCRVQGLSVQGLSVQGLSVQGLSVYHCERYYLGLGAFWTGRVELLHEQQLGSIVVVVVRRPEPEPVLPGRGAKFRLQNTPKGPNKIKLGRDNLGAEFFVLHTQEGRICL